MSTHIYPDGDILIIVENVSFKVHKKLLGLASVVFKDMIDHAVSNSSYEEEISILVIEQENAQDFNDLLSFIYPNTYEQITRDNIVRLLRISDKFMVESLIMACKKFLEDYYRRDPMLTFLLADTYNFKSLYKESSKLILNNYQNFIHEPLFKRFSEKARSSLNERYIKFLFGICSIANGKILSDYIHKCSNVKHDDVLENELKNRVIKDLTSSPSIIYEKIFLQINGEYNRKCNDHFTNKYLPEKIGDLLGNFEALGDGAVGAVGTVHDEKYIFIEK